MNFQLSDMPNSGINPIVHMDIMLQGKVFGTLSIKLFRDSFPAGVENFFNIANASTYHIEEKGFGDYKYQKQMLRTYEDCKFFKLQHNNYIISGDIYANTGRQAGTIYYDEPIPSLVGEYYYPFDTKGLVALVPFKNTENDLLFYDSTFMIALDNMKPGNQLEKLTKDHIVIGYVYNGIDLLDNINILIKPYAGRKYPLFTIGKCKTVRSKI